MKNITLLLSFVLFSLMSFSQKPVLYNIHADGIKQLDSAMIDAEMQNKHIMVQIGGNWCPWCFIFNDFIKNDNELDSIVKADYVVIHVNYDGKKESFPILERLEYPHRFGFPVIVITNAQGKRLHTQNSWFLEEGNTYNRKKVLTFLKYWTPKAVSPDSYK